jgi:hypothetical protein
MEPMKEQLGTTSFQTRIIISSPDAYSCIMGTRVPGYGVGEAAKTAWIGIKLDRAKYLYFG